MAFSRDEFISPYSFDTIENSAAGDLFDVWKQTEIIEMERALAGEAVNSGLIGVQPFEKSEFDSIRWAMRDTLLSAFRSAGLVFLYLSSYFPPSLKLNRSKDQDIHSEDKVGEEEAIHRLIQLALLSSLHLNS